MLGLWFWKEHNDSKIQLAYYKGEPKETTGLDRSDDEMANCRVICLIAMSILGPAEINLNFYSNKIY